MYWRRLQDQQMFAGWSAASKLYKNLDNWDRDTLNFGFLGERLGKVSPPHFVYDFSRKLFFLSYPINRPNFIVWLPLPHEILVNICIAVVCFPGCDIINLEINLIFLTKKSSQKWKYLKNEKSFQGEQKVFYIIFKGLLIANNCLRPESACLSSYFFSNNLPLWAATLWISYD